MYLSDVVCKAVSYSAVIVNTCYHIIMRWVTVLSLKCFTDISDQGHDEMKDYVLLNKLIKSFSSLENDHFTFDIQPLPST